MAVVQCSPAAGTDAPGAAGFTGATALASRFCGGVGACSGSALSPGISSTCDSARAGGGGCATSPAQRSLPWELAAFHNHAIIILCFVRAGSIIIYLGAEPAGAASCLAITKELLRSYPARALVVGT